jgi:hypothetical protein
VTALVAVPAFALAPVLFTPAAGTPEPTGAQLPLFILLGALEAVFFGLGVAFAVFGLQYVRRLLPDSPGLAFAAYLSIAFLLGSWWLHDNLHKINGHDVGGLLGIEYGFHVPLFFAGLVLAAAVIRANRPAAG